MRPAALLAKRAAVEAGKATTEELRAEEDDSIMSIIKLQRDAGIKVSCGQPLIVLVCSGSPLTTS